MAKANEGILINLLAEGMGKANRVSLSSKLEGSLRGSSKLLPWAASVWLSWESLLGLACPPPTPRLLHTSPLVTWPGGHLSWSLFTLPLSHSHFLLWSEHCPMVSSTYTGHLSQPFLGDRQTAFPWSRRRVKSPTLVAAVEDCRLWSQPGCESQLCCHQPSSWCLCVSF